MQLTNSFIELLDEFFFVFTTPSFHTFVYILTGWVFSQRRRFITELIFSSGNIDNGHWSPFYRFFSHAAWDVDKLSARLAKLIVEILCPGALLLWAVDDTLCRRRGLTLFGAGMHHDPLLSSRAKPITSWGHDWVVLSLIIVGPFWAPSKVFALPIAFRLYRNRQGLTKGKKNKTKKDKGKKNKTKAQKTQDKTQHRTHPELAVELIGLLPDWFADQEHMVLADSAYGGKSVLSHLPANVHLISFVHPKGVLYAPAAAKVKGSKGRARKKGDRLASKDEWANDADTPWTKLKFDQFGLHTTLAVKTQKALYYKAGKDRLLQIVLTRDVTGQRPDRRLYCTKLDWDARQILSAYACRWAIECSFENCKQHLGLQEPANRLPKAVQRTAPVCMMLYSLIVVWFNEVGHKHVRFPRRPWYTAKSEPSFADMLTTLRRVSYEEQVREQLPWWCPIKGWLRDPIEMASRAV